MFYNRSVISSEQGLFFKSINTINLKCKSYALVGYIHDKQDVEVFTFMKTLPDGNVKGVQASKLFIANDHGFNGYQICFNFFRKEV
jgi:hypothetical protein